MAVDSGGHRAAGRTAVLDPGGRLGGLRRGGAPLGCNVRPPAGTYPSRQAKKPKRAEPETPPKEKKKKKPRKEPGEGRPKPSFTLEDGKDALRTLIPPLKQALGRTRRGIRVKPLRLSLVLGGREDPAASAQLYGELQAAVWGGMPFLERLLDIRDTYIHMDVDFNASGTAVEGEAGVSLRIGTLLAVGFGLAFPALGWFLRWRKRCRTRPPKPGKEPGKAPPPEEPPTEHPAA